MRAHKRHKVRITQHTYTHIRASLYGATTKKLWLLLLYNVLFDTWRLIYCAFMLFGCGSVVVLTLFLFLLLLFLLLLLLLLSLSLCFLAFLSSCILLIFVLCCAFFFAAKLTFSASLRRIVFVIVVGASLLLLARRQSRKAAVSAQIHIQNGAVMHINSYGWKKSERTYAPTQPNTQTQRLGVKLMHTNIHLLLACCYAH